MEKVKVIKENLNFKELPKDMQKILIDNSADYLISIFDEGVYNKKTATIDAKNNYENEDYKYVLYHSNIHGIQAENQEDFYREEY